MSEFADLNLDNLLDGELRRRFEEAISECLINIADPELHHSTEKKRTITMKLTICAPRDLKTVEFDADCQVKLVRPPVGGETLRFDPAKGRALIFKPRQAELFDEEDSGADNSFQERLQ